MTQDGGATRRATEAYACSPFSPDGQELPAAKGDLECGFWVKGSRLLSWGGRETPNVWFRHDHQSLLLAHSRPRWSIRAYAMDVGGR